MRVSHLLAEKGREVWSIEADQAVLAAIQVMADRHVGVIVNEQDGDHALRIAPMKGKEKRGE